MKQLETPAPGECGVPDSNPFGSRSPEPSAPSLEQTDGSQTDGSQTHGSQTDGSQTDSSGKESVESEHRGETSGSGTEAGEDFRQYLSRFLGKETSDYFLGSSPDHEPSTWYPLLTSTMGEQVSAVALWDALREGSSVTEKTCYKKVTQKSVGGGGWCRGRGHLTRLTEVRCMFHLAQLRQGLSCHLLSSKPPLFSPVD